jgi:hypothetical protein
MWNMVFFVVTDGEKLFHPRVRAHRSTPTCTEVDTKVMSDSVIFESDGGFFLDLEGGRVYGPYKTRDEAQAALERAWINSNSGEIPEEQFYKPPKQ